MDNERLDQILQLIAETYAQNMRTGEKEHYSSDQLMEMLVPEERMFASSLLAIAEKYGKLGDDGGIWIGYEGPDENDDAEMGINCENCALHESENVCKIIETEIHPMGKCRLAVIPDELVSEMKDEDEMEDDDEDEEESGD